MAISQGDILRIVASLVFPDDVIMQNVFHMAVSTLVGTGDEADITDDAVGYVDKIYANHDAQMDHEITGDEVKVYEYDAVDADWDEIGTGALTVTTASTADYLPHGVALLQTFYTLEPDVQGRKFWGGFGEGNQADGSWTGTVLTQIVLTAADVVTTYIGTETGSTYQPIVWSPTRGTGYAYSGVVTTNTICSYQRRRKPGVGI